MYVHLEVTAAQLRLAQQMLLAACLVIEQAHSQHRVSRQPLEARWLSRLEVRLQRLLGRCLVHGVTYHIHLH